jgi:uncharacterized membrane-anchored protein YitT (DUF2179 family)
MSFLENDLRDKIKIIEKSSSYISKEESIKILDLIIVVFKDSKYNSLKDFLRDSDKNK